MMNKYQEALNNLIKFPAQNVAKNVTLKKYATVKQNGT